MMQEQLRQIEDRIQQWRATHPDIPSRRAAYRGRIIEFALNSMAMEGEPVDKERLEARLSCWER